MNTILSYKDWAASIVSTSPEARSHDQYLKYLNSVYVVASDTTAPTNYSDNYIQFTKNLQNLFEGSIENEKLKYLNYNDADEVRNAIPALAVNLKKIAQSLAQTRKDPRSTAAQYSDIDSIRGLQSAVYTELCKKYVADHNVAHADIYDALFEVSVDVKELYDDTAYYDKDPSMAPSGYYDVDANQIAYSKIDPIPSGLIDWVAKSGFNSVSPSNPELIQIPDSQNIADFIEFDLSGANTAESMVALTDAYMGESHFYVNGENISVFSNASHQSENILNRYYPTIAMVPMITDLYSIGDIGGYETPNNLSLSILHGRNREFNFFAHPFTKIDFPDPILYSNGVSLTKIYQSSPVVYNATLNWIDIKYYTKKARGILGNSKYYQEMIPYKTTYEKTNQDDIGVSRLIENLDPWYGPTDTAWKDTSMYPPDFRSIYNIDQWYADVQDLVGYEYAWSMDMFGTNYAVYKDVDADILKNSYKFKESATGIIYVRGFSGYIVPLVFLIGVNIWDDMEYWNDLNFWPSVITFSDIDFVKIKEMQVYYNTMVVVSTSTMSSANDAIAVQDIQIGNDGFPVLLSNRGYNFNYDVDQPENRDGYAYFDHFYDDRTHTLYVITNKLIDKVVHIKIYTWKDGKASKILDTKSQELINSNDLGYSKTSWQERVAPDTSYQTWSDTEANNPTEVIWNKRGIWMEYVDMVLSNVISIGSKNIDINVERNEMIISYITKIDGGTSYISMYVYDLLARNVAFRTYNIVFNPATEGTGLTDEPKNIIDINYFDNNLIFVVEGSSTNTKYLQVVQLNQE